MDAPSSLIFKPASRPPRAAASGSASTSSISSADHSPAHLVPFSLPQDVEDGRLSSIRTGFILNRLVDKCDPRILSYRHKFPRLTTSLFHPEDYLFCLVQP